MAVLAVWHGVRADETAKVHGRVFAERADDLSWENDLVAFRAYGPATQAKGERALGYDLFLKYPGRGLVLERLYGAQCSADNWHTVDSLRRTDPQAAKDFENSFTYHLDHGYGMDPYPVGATLGAGATALLDAEGNPVFQWCYDTVEILENGPQRFRAHLRFAPLVVEGDTVTEHRLITLEAGSHLNRTEVWYEGQKSEHCFMTGVPRRDDSPAVTDAANSLIAYADPCDHQEGHTAMLGIVFESPVSDITEHCGHIALLGSVSPGERIVYWWGNTWPSSDIADMEGWRRYLEQKATDLKN